VSVISLSLFLSPKPANPRDAIARAVARWIRGLRANLPRCKWSVVPASRGAAPRNLIVAISRRNARRRERPRESRSPRTISRAVNQSEQRTRPSVNARVQRDVIYLRTKTIISLVAAGCDAARRMLAIAYPLLLRARFFFVSRPFISFPVVDRMDRYIGSCAPLETSVREVICVLRFIRKNKVLISVPREIFDIDNRALTKPNW